MIKVGILGGLGKMGRSLIQAISNYPQLELEAVGFHQNTSIPEALSSFPFTSSLDKIYASCDIVIDFTQAPALVPHVQKALEYKKPMVIGTTGLTEQDFSYLEEAKNKIPLLYSPNMSLSIILLTQMVEYLAKILDNNYDIEILDIHHRYKKDAPSGTALALGQAAARGRQISDKYFCFDRSRTSFSRPAQEIGFATLRGGHIIGDHQVIFASDEDVITLSHRTLNREIFAKGALQATLWLYNQPPGLYSLEDIVQMSLLTK